MTTENEKVKRKKKKGKTPNVISFEEEFVPKHVAQEILSKEGSEIVKNKEETQENKTDYDTKKSKKKRKNRKHEEEDETNGVDETSAILNDSDISGKKKKKKKVQLDEEEHNEQEQDDPDSKPKKKRKKLDVQEPQAENSTDPEKQKKPESIRAQKRTKYAKLLEEKKIKTELALQQKSLNYLSKWKHSRNEWKFEKLRQIWLHHNMYDEAKVPQEFWGTLVEYFSSSRGKARDVMLKDAVKIIEEESSEDAERTVKVERARDIIQNLQE